MRYVCNNCNSIFTNPSETKLGGNWVLCCPMCNSANIKKDRNFKQQEQDIYDLVNQLEVIKMKITELQVKCGLKLEKLEAITFSDTTEDLREISNYIKECIENTERY